jgi:ABC-2 type transport system ATP-binding protein
MIVVENLTKKFGDVTAVNNISFEVQPGVVTGFLGPNGAGKSTTMRMILGLDKATSGRALVNGIEYRKATAPISELGALLEAKSVDKGRSARNHLLALGATVGISKSRVNELLEMVGLTDVAKKSAGAFSLGMGQRLGIATALLADPKVVMLDEPVNGLDPDGILWIRNLLRELANDGRTVFLSSHLMSEMEMTADHLIVIGRGEIIQDTSMEEFIASAGIGSVRVVAPDAGRLVEALKSAQIAVELGENNELMVTGSTSEVVGELAARNQIVLHELTPIAPSLEEAFMMLTRDSVEFHGATHV